MRLTLCTAVLAQKPFDVRWSDERLSVRAANAPLGDVMAEVARLTGIEIEGRDNLTRRLSVEFTDLTPQEALARLLEGLDYVIQRRPGQAGATDGALVVRIHSVDGYSLPTETFSGPILVKALDVLMAVEAIDVAETGRKKKRMTRTPWRTGKPTSFRRRPSLRRAHSVRRFPSIRSSSTCRT